MIEEISATLGIEASTIYVLLAFILIAGVYSINPKIAWLLSIIAALAMLTRGK